MRIAVASTGVEVASRCRLAHGALERMRGLLRRPPLQPGEALVLDRAPQVHTLGLRHPIDVVFCDRDWRVLEVVPSLRPNRLSRWVRGARYAIELPPGTVDRGLIGEVLTVT